MIIAQGLSVLLMIWFGGSLYYRVTEQLDDQMMSRSDRRDFLLLKIAVFGIWLGLTIMVVSQVIPRLVDTLS